MRVSGQSWLWCVVLPIVGGACGARTELHRQRVVPDAAPPPCATDSDCPSRNLCEPQRCMRGTCEKADPVECDDGDECTSDTCVPSSGKCEHLPLSKDGDGDGFAGPRTGFAPGAPGACGNDCDDEKPEVYPGAPEVCDGLDNDCNGIIDDGAVFVPSGEDAVRISSTQDDRALGGGIAYNGEIYGVAYAGKRTKWTNYFKGLTRTGSTAIDNIAITNVNADAFPGPIIWTGTQFAVAWIDARLSDNYEVYFNRLDTEGNKLGPDLRITNADDFSIHADISWKNDEFTLVWDDRRAEASVGTEAVAVYGQRVSRDGRPVGDNVLLTPSVRAEYPSIAAGTSKFGLVYTTLDGLNIGLRFRTAEFGLGATGPVTDLNFADAHGPVTTWVSDRFAVFWSKYDVGPGDAIYGATISEQGAVIQPAKRLTFGANFARGHGILALGDRMIMVWSDDHDGNYELYTQMLDKNLNTMSARRRITVDPADSLGAALSFGPNGDVGILFEDWRSGTHQLYFARLLCQMPR